MRHGVIRLKDNHTTIIAKHIKGKRWKKKTYEPFINVLSLQPLKPSLMQLSININVIYIIYECSN